MKKVISLALAMAMALSMTSMAANFIQPGDAHAGAEGLSEEMRPGETYHISIDSLGGGALDVANGNTVEPGDVTSKNFSVRANWDVGSALVASVGFCDDSDACITIELKENYTIEDAKSLEGTITLTAKKDFATKDAEQNVLIEKGDKFELEIEEGMAAVCNIVEDIDGGNNRDDATAISPDNNTIYNVTSSGWFDFGGDGDRLSSVLVRLAEDEQIFAYWNEDPVEAIEDKYYDLDADLSYITFVANPDLDRNAEVAIQGDYSDQYYLYEIVNGDINEIDYEFDPDDGLFTFPTRELGSYVISDMELTAEADEPAEDDEPAADDTATQNPDTGANDVVGVAVALAAVSLVAAGAVSLKK